MIASRRDGSGATISRTRPPWDGARASRQAARPCPEQGLFSKGNSGERRGFSQARRHGPFSQSEEADSEAPPAEDPYQAPVVKPVRAAPAQTDEGVKFSVAEAR